MMFGYFVSWVALVESGVNRLQLGLVEEPGGFYTEMMVYWKRIEYKWEGIVLKGVFSGRGLEG